LSPENPSPAPGRLHPALVLGAYGDELAHGARIAIFGSATLGLAEELVFRGARVVHVYDTDSARIAEANAGSHDRSIFYAPLPDSGDVGVRDGAFDLVIVPDLSFFRDAAGLMALVRRVVSPLGAALIASPNADVERPLLPASGEHPALGYYELYEVVAAHFSSVRMIGQAPFVGYAVAEFSVEDPEPTIDSSLAESEGKEPEWFLALASDRDTRLDAFALIELPIEVLSGFSRGRYDHPSANLPTGPDTAPGPTPESTGTVLINILEAEREAALESLRQQEQVVKAERFRADHATQELSAAREELALLREHGRALGERLVSEEARRAALEIELQAARHNPELAALRNHMQDQDASSRSLVDDHEREVSRLETQLRDRGREIQELRAEVERREHLVRELIATKVTLPREAAPSDAPAAPDRDDGLVADLSARLDRLASDAARREADLVGARWKIAQLERELLHPR
jgi:hypothetical protein